MFVKARVWFFLFVALRARPAVGTDNYSYKSGEFAIVSGGRRDRDRGLYDSETTLKR